MSSPLDSPQWYRVRALRPRLRPHVAVRRHLYRGRRWYVLADRSTGRSHRVDANAYQLLGSMNGETCLDQLWQDACERLGDEAPSQDEIIRLLGSLYTAELLQCELPADAHELFERREERLRQKRLGRLRSPFSLRLPLLDPEALLTRFEAFARRLFSPIFALLWLILVGVAGVVAALHAPELYSAASTRLAQPQNLLALALVYPLVKGLHELGHALAIKAWRGEVHETGIMLLVFMPVPYVDATSANAFESKWARATVAGAGIAVELGLASLGLFAWLLFEPGILRSVAFDIMLIGGISTLLFNGNPLLRFDGYYVLADVLEIPNLASRSSGYYGYLLRRYVLGIETARSPAHAPGERGWFLVYALAAFVYRTAILIAILLFVLNISRTLGVLLGSWALFGQVLVPTFKRLRSLRSDYTHSDHGQRGIAVVIMTMLALTAILFAPVPIRSTAQGIVWLAEDGYVRAGADCFVERIVATPGKTVEKNTPLLTCSDPLLDAELRLAEATLAELQIKRRRARERDRNSVRRVEDEIRVARERVDAARMQRSRLTVYSSVDGLFFLPTPDDWPGRFITQGETLGYILHGQDTSVRVAIEQSDIGRVRNRIERATVRFADRPDAVFEARVSRTLPGATHALPSAALGTSAGGILAIDPDDADGRTAVAPVFQIELRLASAGAPQHVGGRAFVRLEHGTAPLVSQVGERLRQLLLKHLAV